jgi:uncharacterized membrane protein YagU involved in acid resistance
MEELVADLAVGMVAGLVASGLIGPLQKMLYALTPRPVKRREEKVRPGDPTEIAAKELRERTGVQLGHGYVERGASAIHYATGATWGPVYGLLRRYSGMNPIGAALVAGTSMSLIVDEAVTPAMGFSAPSREYPTATHIRGVLAHLAFGAVVAVATEALNRPISTWSKQIIYASKQIHAPAGV